jgi:hypothetical protein
MAGIPDNPEIFKSVSSANKERPRPYCRMAFAGVVDWSARLIDLWDVPGWVVCGGRSTNRISPKNTGSLPYLASRALPEKSFGERSKRPSPKTPTFLLRSH